jgi:hypothetical protein
MARRASRLPGGGAAITAARGAPWEKRMKAAHWFWLPLVAGTLLASGPLFAEAPNKAAARATIAGLLHGWASMVMTERSRPPADRVDRARGAAEEMRHRLETIACDPNDKESGTLPMQFYQIVSEVRTAVQDYYLIDAAAACQSGRLAVKFQVKAK